MTDEQDKAQHLLATATYRMTRGEIEFLHRVVDGDTHLLGQWASKEDARMWTWIETNFAEDLK